MELAYLDHAAATPLRPAVREEMLSLLTGAQGNPSSVHRWGQRARQALDDARQRIARVVGAASGEVFFVRGGTEANNLAILGRAARVRESGAPPLLVRTPVEHSSVREAVAAAVEEGGREASLPVAPDGSTPERELRRLLSEGPALVSIQWVNHETGSILPVPEVAAACRAAAIPVHVDAVQATGRIGIDLREVPVDLLTLSGHKIGGPRGVGALVIRDRDLLRPRLFGGGQEGDLRPGTEDVASAGGLAAALELAVEELDAETVRLTALRNRLEEGLRSAIPDLRVHGAEGPRAPHVLNVGVAGLPRDILPRALDMEGVGASAGSACRSGGTDVSPVLAGYYGEEAAADVAPLRLSLGWCSTEEEVEIAIERIPLVVARVRAAGLAAGLEEGRAS